MEIWRELLKRVVLVESMKTNQPYTFPKLILTPPKQLTRNSSNFTNKPPLLLPRGSNIYKGSGFKIKPEY
jgi:hypothetical protein